MANDYTSKVYAPFNMYIPPVLQKSYSGITGLDLQTLKTYLRVDHNFEDNMIMDLVPAVIQEAESYCGIHIVPTTGVTTITNYYAQAADIREAVLNDIISIQIRQLDGTLTAPGEYRVNKLNNMFRLFFPNYYTSSDVIITWYADMSAKTGFFVPDGQSLPPAMLRALKIGINDAYDNNRSGWVMGSLKETDMFHQCLNKFKISYIY